MLLLFGGLFFVLLLLSLFGCLFLGGVFCPVSIVTMFVVDVCFKQFVVAVVLGVFFPFFFFFFFLCVTVTVLMVSLSV